MASFLQGGIVAGRACESAQAVRRHSEVGDIVRQKLSSPGEKDREATGQEDETLEAYGDSSSNAESMALRRAAAKFGLGIALYDQ